ncbi:MAG: hypothetical protein ABI700_25120 [Chloroflexota bacterium]
MSSRGGIAVINTLDFRLDLPQFSKALREHWRDAQVPENPWGDFEFGMTLNGRFEDFAGHTLNGQQITWNSGNEEFAEFLVWFRQYISDEYDLLAWSKDFGSYIVLTHDTTSSDIVSAFSSNRYDFEMSSQQNNSQNTQVIAEKIQQVWHATDASVQFKESANFHWFLRTQQGRIDEDGITISFDDTDLQFAAKFAIWCRSLLSNDQTFTVEYRGYQEPVIHVQTELTSSTTEDELFNFLTKSFAKE